MWTVRDVTCVPIRAATRPRALLFPSALADPAERRLGPLMPAGRRFGRRLMLAIAPGAAGAVLVVALPAGDANHAPYSAVRFPAIAPLPCPPFFRPFRFGFIGGLSGAQAGTSGA